MWSLGIVDNLFGVFFIVVKNFDGEEFGFFSNIIGGWVNGVSNVSVMILIIGIIVIGKVG